MKKFVVLTLVLCMASSASAVLSIGAAGGPSEIIMPSSDLILDIQSSGDYGPFFMMVVENAHGTITGGSTTPNSGDFPANYTDNVPYYAYYAGISPDPLSFAPTVNGISWALGYNLDESNISGVVLNQINFHYEGSGDAVIQLWNSTDYGDTWVLGDELTVHPAPEPLTVALLGLGGLFLRRRK